MKKKIKTSQILSAYNVLNSAKLGSMADDDKVKAWKIACTLKPIATKFEEDSKDAADKLKPKDKDFAEKYQKAQEYERMVRIPNVDVDKLPMGPAEYAQFVNEVLIPYNNLVDAALKDFANKEVEVEFEPLSDEAFGKLMIGNDWTMGQSVALSDIVVGEDKPASKKGKK